MKSALLAEPAAVGFGLVVEGSEAQERRVKLRTASEDPVKVTLPPQVPGSRVQYSVETKTPGREYDLVVRLVPPFAAGPISESIALILDHPKQKSLEVRSSGTVAPRLELAPASLQMTEVPAGQPFRGQVRFENRGSRPVKVLKASGGVPEVQVTVAEVTPGRAYDLRLEVPSGFAPPPNGTQVRVKTDDPEHPELTFTLLPRPVAVASPATLAGRPAPAFSLKTVAGREVSNATAAGKVTLLDFFAADCPHCKRQIPRLTALLKEWAGKPVQLVLVTQKMRGDFTTDQVRDVLKKSGVEPEALDLVVEMTNASGKAFLVNSYPALVVLGQDGKVASAVAGNAADIEAQVKGQVEILLGGRAVPVAVAPAPRPLVKSRPAVVKR